jgi:hypothetical protein
MEISLTTPALLFPAISLLLLAFTNRFLAIASLIRNLHAAYQQDPNRILAAQIKNLRTRLFLIRSMQIFGIGALFLCVLCMFLLFYGKISWGERVFGASLVLMMASLSISIAEIQISVQALNIQLSDMEGLSGGNPVGKLKGWLRKGKK